MQARTSLILAGVAVVAVLGGWYFGVRTQGTAASRVFPGRLAFPDLTPRLERAAHIEIRHQGETLALDRKGDVWGVKEDADYPAEPGKVHSLLVGLAGLRLTEPRTAEPAEFGRLGVEDPDKPKADSTLVSVLDAAGKPIAALIVGHSRTRGQPDMPDQMFVRRPGDDRSWLAEGRLPLEGDALMWLDRDVVNIDHTKIDRVTDTRAGQPIELVREGDTLAMKLPAEHPPLDPAKLADVARALEYLSFMRVQPAAKFPGQLLGRGVFTTTDGLRLDVTVNKAGNEIWARLAAAGEGAAKPAAERLDKKFAGWAYELGGWKEKVLVPSMDDLKLPAPKPAAAPSPAKPIPVGPMPVGPMPVGPTAAAPPATPAAPPPPAAPSAAAAAKPETAPAK